MQSVLPKILPPFLQPTYVIRLLTTLKECGLSLSSVDFTYAVFSGRRTGNWAQSFPSVKPAPSAVRQNLTSGR